MRAIATTTMTMTVTTITTTTIPDVSATFKSGFATPLAVSFAEPSHIWLAHIFAAAVRHFPDEIAQNPQFALWFVAAAHVRSGFDPAYCDKRNRRGIFALSAPIFDEMKRRLRYGNNVSPRDPLANIAAAVAYLRWVYERYAQFAPDSAERIKCALLSLDAGYFRTKFALEKCLRPATFAQAAVLVERTDDAERVKEIAACVP